MIAHNVTSPSSARRLNLNLRSGFGSTRCATLITRCSCSLRKHLLHPTQFRGKSQYSLLRVELTSAKRATSMVWSEPGLSKSGPVPFPAPAPAIAAQLATRPPAARDDLSFGLYGIGNKGPAGRKRRCRGNGSLRTSASRPAFPTLVIIVQARHSHRLAAIFHRT